MEDSKYYTPSIEEFCIGFEYEIFDLVLHKVTLTNRMACQIITQPLIDKVFSFFSYIQEELTFDRIRVKFLDREDIESFGFIRHLDCETLQGFTLHKEAIEKYTLAIRPNGRVGIALEDTITERPLFNGVIKNKSEFKRVLIQLGIL